MLTSIENQNVDSLFSYRLVEVQMIFSFYYSIFYQILKAFDYIYLIGGNKMDPNLVAALMNGRNNQDGFGGANGWWLWIIVLFWLWGGRGFGNGFGNGNECCANGLPAQLNNDYGRELLMQAIQGNRSAIDQIANALNCTTTQLQSAICNVQGAIDKVAGQVGMTSQAVINAVQQRCGASSVTQSNGVI